MKKLLLLFILIFSAMTAVSVLAQGGIDPSAKKILDQVSAKLKTQKGVESNFNLRTEDAKGKSLGNKNGNVLIKDFKYRITYPGQEIICDGKSVWSYDKTANEVTITDFDPAPNAFNVQKLYTNFYYKDFLYKLNGEKKQGAKTLAEIEMTPTDKGKTYHKVFVYVDKMAQSIYSVLIHEKNGNKYIYTINSLNGNAVINDRQLFFNKLMYPGVKTVDLRKMVNRNLKFL